MKRIILTILLTVLGIFFFTRDVSADHAWGSYHWARTSNPFTIKLGDNLTSAWDPYLNTASSDWNSSNVLDTLVVTGNGSKTCRATSGRVEVCNKKYGFNGWLGIAQIWVSGSHITQGTTKLNDSYFNMASYNTPEWKQFVVCQEVGHTFGLDHQDEDFGNANLGSCMDYTNNPSTNQHPNAHDYEQLQAIYSHNDAFNSMSQVLGQSLRQTAWEIAETRGEWGRQVRDNGSVGVYERDFGAGNKVFTFVVWAQ